MSLLDTASLIVTPNGYKEGKLYSVIPSDGSGDLSVTRATTATRVNSAGLVELVPYNLLSYSEDFSNAAWSKTALSVSTNSATAPNGLNTADTLTNTSGSAIVLQASTAVNTSAVVTFSTYFKKTNNDWVAVNIARNGATTYGELYVWFNLSTGAVGSNLPDGAAVLVDTDIENVGNGWYRCSVTGYVPNAVSYQGFLFFPDGNGSFNRVTSQSVYAWGAQLVEDSVAKDYQKTETKLNIPRLDYSNGTCPSLLVEPQRTNLVTWSSSFDNAAWIKLNGSVTANATTSPDGTTNADSFIPNTTSGFHALRSNNFNQSSTTSHSWFLKANGYSKIAVRESDLAVGNYASFDLSTGTLISTSQSGIIENVGNGWFRCTLVDTNTGAGAQTSIFVLPDSYTTGDPLIAWSGDGIKGVYAYGAQAELGSYPTSYIPTTSASVTRNADVISKTGISSLIGQTEGTIFVEEIFDANVSNNGGIDDVLVALTDGTTNNLILVLHYGASTSGFSNSVRFFIRTGNVNQVLIDSSSLTSGVYKIALAYSNNDVVAYINGVQIGTDISALIPTTSVVTLVDPITLNAATKTVNTKSVALWKTRLTNDQLATLTTI